MDIPTFENYIKHPDTVPFIVRSETILDGFFDEHPYIRLGKSFSGGNTIIYTDRTHIKDVLSSVATIQASCIHPPVFGLMGTVDLAASGITQVQNHPVLDLRGSGVLLGFVDTGIDYTLDAFRYEDGSSKIAAIWDQSISGNAPEGYFYGSQYTNDDINTALQSGNPLDIVPHTDTVGHGTFLASVAGSREGGGYKGAAPDAEIIAVKLKRAQPFSYEFYLVPSEKNAYGADDIMMGIQYIIDTARLLNRPVAICIGLGTNIGGHNGLCVLEDYITNIAGNTGVAICAAAGNESQAAHHTMGQLTDSGELQDINLRVGATGQDIYMEIWNYAIDRISISIRSPSGENIARIPARSNETFTHPLLLEPARVEVSYYFPVLRSGEQLTRLRIYNATQGIWNITLHGDSILDGRYHAWLPITGFIDSSIQFLTPFPNYTITAPGTAPSAVTCGAYNTQNNSLAPTSSWGPTRMPSLAPDLVAPGINVSGSFPYGHGSMSGTSVSTAVTTGACALMLQWGIVNGNDPSYNTFRIRAQLTAGCDRDAGIQYPNNKWGYGRLNLMRTFKMLRVV